MHPPWHYCARTGRPNSVPTDNNIGAATCSATVGRSHAALFGASPAVPTSAPVGSADATVALHNPSSHGSPLSCAPPPGEVGPVTGGSTIAGAIGYAAIDCSVVGVTRSAPCLSWVWGIFGSSTRPPPSAVDGCRSSFDSALRQANNSSKNKTSS